MGEPLNCQTYLEFEIELDDRVENAFSIELDRDLFWLALALQVLRISCQEPEDCKKDDE